MASDVDSYLKELQQELRGADPALIQDALSTTQEHLEAELDALREQYGDQPAELERKFASVIERYGSPDEVAAAYLAAETSFPPPPGPSPAPSARPAKPMEGWAGFFMVAADPDTYRSLIYMLLALATGILYFTVVVTGLSLVAGLFILVIGIPVALGFLALVRGLSLAEGRMVEALLGVRMPRRGPLEPSEKGVVDRLRYWAKDRRTWTTMLYMVSQLPLGIIYFSVAVSGLATGLWLIGLPFVQLLTGHSFADIGDREWLMPPGIMPLSIIAGVLIFFVMLHLIRAIGRVHGAYAKSMLVRLGW